MGKGGLAPHPQKMLEHLDMSGSAVQLPLLPLLLLLLQSRPKSRALAASLCVTHDSTCLAGGSFLMNEASNRRALFLSLSLRVCVCVFMCNENICDACKSGLVLVISRWLIFVHRPSSLLLIQSLFYNYYFLKVMPYF